MEKEKNTFKQGTRKTQIRFNGGGHNIGGLLLLGGALAVGSLLATLAVRKGNRRRDSDDKSSCSKRKEEKPSQGLHFILQTSSPTISHGNQCCTSNGLTEMAATKIDDPSELTSTPSLISEENPSSAPNSNLDSSENGDQEILGAYDSKQDSTKTCGKHCRVEEFSMPELKNDTVEETNLMATTEIAEKDVTDAVRTSIEDISSVQYAEEDYDEEKKKKQAKDKFLAEGKVQVAEKEEPVDVKTCAEKDSLKSVEEDDGDNLEEGSPLMKDVEANNEEAIDEVDEEDAIEEILSVQSTEEDVDYEGENKQAKEKLLLEEKTEEEERIAVETLVKKTSLVSVEDEDGDGNLGKELPLTDIPEVKNEEAIGEVEEDAIQSTDKDVDENKQAKEKLLLEEKIKVEEEEERIAVKTCAENTSSNSVEEDDGVHRVGERPPLMAKPEVKQEEESKDEVAEEEPLDVLKMSIEKISSVQSMEEEDDDQEKKHSIENQEDVGDIDKSDDEHIVKKSDESSGGSSVTSDAEEIWPAESVEAISEQLMNVMKNSRLSAAKTAEQDENNKTEEFSHFNSCTDINQTTGNSTFVKKEENLEFPVWNKQATKYLRKWRSTDKHTLIMASILLFLLPIVMHYIIYLLRSDVYQREQK